jgi:TonB family protein
MKGNDIILFAYESGVCMAVLYGMYWILLRKETYFLFNRIYLISTVLFACVLPWLSFNMLGYNFEAPTLTFISSVGEAVRISDIPTVNPPESVLSKSISWQQAVIAIYLAGFTFFFIRFILGIIKIYGLKKNGKKIDFDGYSIIYIKQHIAPFSFFRTIYLNDTLMDSSDIGTVIEHEVTHIRQSHTYDKLFFEICIILNWFNPFMWLIQRSLSITHEYLADNCIKGIDTNPRSYQSFLLKQFHGLPSFMVTNNFNSMIINRIEMMYKSKSTILAKFKPFLIVPPILCLILVFACSDKENEIQTGDPGVATAEQTTSVDQNNTPRNIDRSRTLNIILGPDDKILWYPGSIVDLDPDNPPPLQITDFSETGIRQVLLDRNKALFEKIQEFMDAVVSGEIDIPRDSVDQAIYELKRNDDTGPIVLIKAYKTSKQQNLVSILGEMSIVGIARYTVVDITRTEEAMVERTLNLEAEQPDSNQPESLKSDSEEETPDLPLIIVEEMPRYPGGEEGLYEDIYNNLNYPEIAFKDQTSGPVIIRFVVSKEGEVTQAEVLRGLSPATDAEAIRVVESLPESFIPGKQAGKLVNVYYIIRVQFPPPNTVT